MLPVEILLQVLHAALPLLSLEELFQARQVNKLFADEILPYIIDSCILDNHPAKWPTMPLAIKRLYLRHKIDHTTCIFSRKVQEVLDAHATQIQDNPSKRDFYIDCICDAARCQPRVLLSDPYPTYVSYETRGFWWDGVNRAPEEDLRVALATSAIMRDDAAELDAVLSQEGDTPLGQGCERWGGIPPVHLAAVFGDKQVTKVLLRHDKLREYVLGNAWLAPLAVSAVHEKTGAVEAWVEVLEKGDPRLVHALRRALIAVARRGMLEMMVFIESYLLTDATTTATDTTDTGPDTQQDTEGDTREKIRYETTSGAVQNGQVNAARHCLIQGGFNLHMRTTSFPRGLLMTALLECPLAQRPEMVRLLLEHGVNPDNTFYERDDSVRATALQKAVLQRNAAVVKLLLEAGADPNGTRRARSGQWHALWSVPPVVHAVRERSVEMVHLLVQAGASRRVCLPKKTFVVYTGGARIEEGWEVWTAEYQKTKYSIAMIESRHRVTNTKH